MGLLRFIIIALIVYLVILIFRRWTANKNSPTSRPQDGASAGSTVMVQCKTCKLHIPENEALQKDGDYFCSQEHLEGKQD